jgi:hypothetical protein
VIWLFRLLGDLGLGRAVRRTVVEVRWDLHRELRKLALLNDLRIYVLVNGVLEEFLGDEERVKALIRRLRVGAVGKSY